VSIITPEQKVLLPFIPGTFRIINPENAQKATIMDEHQIKQTTPKCEIEASFF
jgi:hypothetical protein